MKVVIVVEETEEIIKKGQIIGEELALIHLHLMIQMILLMISLMIIMMILHHHLKQTLRKESNIGRSLKPFTRVTQPTLPAAAQDA